MTHTSDMSVKRQLRIIYFCAHFFCPVFFSKIVKMKFPGVPPLLIFIDCSALHRASNFNFSAFVFCVDGRGAAAGLGLVEDRHDFETESTTRKMQVGKKVRN